MMDDNMPIERNIREKILAYCENHLPKNSGQMFDFLDDDSLRNKIVLEFDSARYIYKMGEALQVDSYRQHAHVKFQIVQYAGIYEAIIVHLLWGKFKDHPAVREIEAHASYKSVSKMPKTVTVLTEKDAPVHLCILSKQKTPIVSIKFDDKVNAASTIGFIDAQIAAEIKEFYKLRNAIHLQSAVKNNIKYEIENSLLAFRRLLPFTRGIKGFLKSGKLPANARPKPVSKKQ